VRCEKFHFGLHWCIWIQNRFVSATDHTRERWGQFLMTLKRSNKIVAMKSTIIILSLLFCELIILGQDDVRSGIIYGDNHAFGLTAPEGWVLDNKAGVSQGLYAVFYKQGESWEKATTVMYANTASLRDKAHKTLDELITYDLNTFKKEYPDIQISDENDITINEKTTAKIKYLSGKSYGNFEVMAYIDAGKTGVMLILSSRTKDGFEKSLQAFAALVKSYIFIADKVVIDSKNK
jgi:hypothetical protein